jgi:hypothetical protein
LVTGRRGMTGLLLQRAGFLVCAVTLFLGASACSSTASGKPYVLAPQPPDGPVQAAEWTVTVGYSHDVEPFSYGIGWTPSGQLPLQLGASQEDAAGTNLFVENLSTVSELGGVGRFDNVQFGCGYGKPTIAAHRDGWFVEVNLSEKTVYDAGGCDLSDENRQILTEAMSSLRFTDFHGWLAYAEASRPTS